MLNLYSADEETKRTSVINKAVKNEAKKLLENVRGKHEGLSRKMNFDSNKNKKMCLKGVIKTRN